LRVGDSVRHRDEPLGTQRLVFDEFRHLGPWRQAKISVILGSSSFQTSMHGVKLNFENSSERRKHVQIAMLLEHHPQKYQKVYMWLQH
jgi:hypothetical protein